MKILIIRNYPSYIDVEKNTYNIQEIGLAKALVRKGNSVDIVFWTNKQEEIKTISFDKTLSINIIYKKGKSFLKNAFFDNLDDIIESYDVIQCCEYNQLLSWHYSKKYKNKIVIYHGPYYSSFNVKYNILCAFFDFFFLKRYIKLGTKFIVKSKLSKEFLTNKGISEENIAVAGVGLDLDNLLLGNDNETDFSKEMKNYFGIKLLYIGKIEKRRNCKFLIDLLNELLNLNIDSHLFIIGDGKKRQRDSLSLYIERKGLSKNITWKNRVEQQFLPQIYKNSDYFILPTHYEIFGMVLLEAMYYKNIVLTSLNGGSSVVIKDKKNGFIIDVNDVNSTAHLIKNIYEKKYNITDIKNEAYNTIVNKCLWDNKVDIFLEQYSSNGGD